MLHELLIIQIQLSAEQKVKLMNANLSKEIYK